MASLVHLLRGDLGRAFRALERGRSFCERGDLVVPLAQMRAALGYACALAGHVAEAVPLLERALAEIEPTGYRPRDALRTAWLGEAYLLAGRIEDAARVADTALGLARERPARGVEAETLRLLGEIASRRDPVRAGDAEAHFHRAMALADALGMRPLQARCGLGLGRLYRATGEFDPGRTETARALAALRSMDMALWIPDAEAELQRLSR
jgi:tetratricopeptide (TPR) repeat protein